MIYPTCTGNIKCVKCKKMSYYKCVTIFRRLHHYTTIKWTPKNAIKDVSIACKYMLYCIRSEQNILHNIRDPTIKFRKVREGIGKSTEHERVISV
jgi:hypothetical protein